KRRASARLFHAWNLLAQCIDSISQHRSAPASAPSRRHTTPAGQSVKTAQVVVNARERRRDTQRMVLLRTSRLFGLIRAGSSSGRKEAAAEGNLNRALLCEGV